MAKNIPLPGGSTPQLGLSVQSNKPAAQSQKGYSLPAAHSYSSSSAIRALRSKPMAEEEEKWYKGTQPTGRETLAQIYTISQQDPFAGQQMWDSYQQLTQDPSTPLYAPYTRASNPAIDHLSELGVDVSEINDDWFARNASVMNHYRTGATGTPLAPSSTSSAENDAAYWYYKVTEAEEITKKAEAEWAALQEELVYWAGRSDRNYSDEEILGRVDWGNYPTLARMDEGRKQGVPLSLNRAVGYSEDAIYGALWAARNDGGTGNSMADSIQYVLGSGNMWEQDARISALLDPTNEAYNPYAAGSTVDDEALYFGVGSFDEGWLERNRAMIASMDETERKMYSKVYDAEQLTLQAEAELAELQAEIRLATAFSSDADAVIASIDWRKYPTLSKMDKSLKSGDIMAMTRAVPYKREDILAGIRGRCVGQPDALDNFAKGVTAVLAGAGKAAPAKEEKKPFWNLGKGDDEKRQSSLFWADWPTGNAETEDKTAEGAEVSSVFAKDSSATEEPSSVVEEPSAATEEPSADTGVKSTHAVEKATPAVAEAPAVINNTAEDATVQEAKKQAAPKAAPRVAVLPSQATGAIDQQRNKVLDAAGPDVATVGTDAEKRVWQYARPSQAHRTMRDLSIAMGLSTLDSAEAIALHREAAVSFATDHYHHASTILATQEAAIDKGAELPYTDEEYAAAKAQMSRMSRDFDILQRNGDTEALEKFSALHSVHALLTLDFDDNPWYLYSSYDALLQQGYSPDMVAALAKADIEFYEAVESGELLRQFTEIYGHGDDVEMLFEAYENPPASPARGTGKSTGKLPFRPTGEYGDLCADFAYQLHKAKSASERNLQDAKYFLLRFNDDFQQAVRDRPFRQGDGGGPGAYDPSQAQYHGNANIDVTGHSAVQDHALEVNADEVRATNAVPDLWKMHVYDSEVFPFAYSDAAGSLPANMTEDELDTVWYLEKTQGEKAAEAYLHYLTNDDYGQLHVRQSVASQEDAAAYAREHPVVANIVAVMAMPYQAVGVVYSLGQQIKGENINPYNSAFSFGVGRDVTRSTSKQMITEELGEGTFLAKAANLSYDVSVSLADSMYGRMLVGTSASPWLMGVGAMSSGIQDAKMRGGTNGQALAFGSMACAAEVGAEYVSNKVFSAAADLADMPTRKALAKCFQMMPMAGLEEGAGELLTEAVTMVSDDVIMGASSTYNLNVQRYLEENPGMTLAAAQHAAKRDAVMQLGYAALAGFVSGEGTQLAGMATGYVFNGHAYASIEESRAAAAEQRMQQQEFNQAYAAELRQQAEQEQQIQPPQPLDAVPMPTETAPAPMDAVPMPASSAPVETAESMADTEDADTVELDVDIEPATRTKVLPPEQKMRAIDVLAEAENSDADGAVVTAVAAVLTDPEQPETAASKGLITAIALADRYGELPSADIVKGILGVPNAPVSHDSLQSAISVAVAFDGDARKVLDNIAATYRVQPGDITALEQAAQADLQQPAAQEAVQQQEHDTRIALRTKELIADGALDGMRPYKTALRHAEENLTSAQTGLEQAQQQQAAAGENFATVSQQHLQNPTDASLRGSVQQATKDLTGAVIVTRQREEAVQKQEAAVQDAKAEHDAVLERTMKEVREQAVTDVAAADQQEAERIAAEEAAAEVLRQNENTVAMAVEDFIASEYPDASPELQDEIRQAYREAAEAGGAQQSEDTQPADPNRISQEAASFASRIAKAFQVNVEFTTQTQLNGTAFRGAYQNGRIILNRSATQGDMLRRTVIHELVHHSEGSGETYTEAADAILEAAYNGNKEQLQTDLEGVKATYRAQFGDSFTEADARAELVAQRAEEIFTEESINRLTAEKPTIAARIWESLKTFVKKIRGVKDTEADRIRRAEQLFRKALERSGEGTGGPRRYAFRSKDGQVMPVGSDAYAANKEIVANMAPIISLEGNPFEKNPDKDFYTRATAYFDTIGNTAYNDVIGSVALDEKGIRHLTSKFLTSRKASLLGAVKDVIESGYVVHTDENHGGHFFDTAVIAAVVELDGQQYYMGVSVKQDRGVENSYYVHDAVFVEKKRPSISHPVVGVSGDAGRIHEGNEQVPIAIILSELADYNRDFQENTKNTAKFSLLPSRNVLNGQIAAHMARMNDVSDGAVPPDSSNTQQQNPNPDSLGERQFAAQTAQRSNAIPDWLKRALWGDRFYERDTNRAQAERAFERIAGEGFDAAHERLMREPSWNADDNVEALVLLHMALRPVDQGGWGNPAAAMELAHRFNTEGTSQGQALQARQLFSRMTPTGMRLWAAGHAESVLLSYKEGHTPIAKRAHKQAQEVESEIGQYDGSDPLAPDENGDVTITPEAVQRWGVPVNERQQALIDHYRLNNVTRPGLFYNKATLKQRMLEAILATPDPNAQTGMGMTLVERLELMQAGAPVVTEADLSYIVDRMQEFVSASEEDQAGRLGDLALARAYEAYGNITPASLREKARTWRYTSMLLSIPSAARNVIGNAAQGATNAVAHDVAVLLDKLVSGVTHERTMALNTMQERAAGWHAFVDETVNTYRDHFIDRATTRRGNDRYNMNQRGRMFQTRVPEALRTMEGFLMSVGDRNVWRKAFVQSMAEQQRVADLNGADFDPDAATERATADANYATFSEDNAVSTALGALKRVPVVGDLFDFIMPFTGVPTNIVKRMGQYSPFGLAWNVGKAIGRAWTGRTFDQHAFVNGVSRGLTGSALMAAGMMLFKMGVIKLGTGEEEDKEYALHTAMGQQYTPYIQIGDQYYSLSALAPFISPLTMGASTMKLLEEDDSLGNAALNAAIAAGDQIFDASYMANLSDIFGGYGSPTENLLTTMGSSMISQNIPSILAQWASALDPYVRNTRDKNKLVQIVKSGLINKLPWLRELLLPAKVDVAGRRVENTDQGALAFVDPFNRTSVEEDPAMIELDRLHKELGTSSHLPSDDLSGTKTALSGVAAPVEGSDKEAYQVRYGELWRLGGSTFDASGNRVVITGVSDLIQSAAYQKMTDQQKANAISGIMSAAKTGTAYEMGEKLGHMEKESDSDDDEYTMKAVRAMPERFAGISSEYLTEAGKKARAEGKNIIPLGTSMDHLTAWYNQTGDGAFIPKGISGSFSRSKVQYDLTGEELEKLWTLYEEKLEEQLSGIDWDGDPVVVAQAVEKAYSSAAKSAKDQYVENPSED